MSRVGTVVQRLQAILATLSSVPLFFYWIHSTFARQFVTTDSVQDCDSSCCTRFRTAGLTRAQLASNSATTSDFA
jgi:hypothetical protein